MRAGTGGTTVRVDLPMRMMQRHADLGTTIFERQYVLDLRAPRESPVRSASTSNSSSICASADWPSGVWSRPNTTTSQ